MIATVRRNAAGQIVMRWPEFSEWPSIWRDKPVQEAVRERRRIDIGRGPKKYTGPERRRR